MRRRSHIVLTDTLVARDRYGSTRIQHERRPTGPLASPERLARTVWVDSVPEHVGSGSVYEIDEGYSQAYFMVLSFIIIFIENWKLSAIDLFV